MNEPHDLDINVWAATCQKVVTGIRNAGAASQMILLPGTNFDSAATLVSSGSAEALMKITNPDGTTDNLLLDIHKYLDEDNSGTHATCTTNNIDAFTSVAQFLRAAGRKGLVSETGASSDATVSTESQTCFPKPLENATVWLTHALSVPNQLLRPKHLHQPKPRRLRRPGRLGRRQLRHKLRPQHDAVVAKQQAGRQHARAAVHDRRVGKHSRLRRPRSAGTEWPLDCIHHAPGRRRDSQPRHKRGARYGAGDRHGNP